MIDCGLPPIDKACGEGLLPHSQLALNELGITIPATIGFRFRGVRFSNTISSATASFSGACGIGLRRTVLHNLLVQRANDLGARCLWNAKQVHLVPGGISANGEVLSAPLVIAADGQNSSLRRTAGLNPASQYRRRYGFRRHYRVAPWSTYMELHWGKRSQIYITPVAADEIGVALISGDPSLRLDRALEQFPEVRSRLTGATATSSEKGSLSVSRTLRRVTCPGLALLGDASGSVDALTGEGMGLCFRQSLALAEAVKAGDLKLYEASHRKLSRRPRSMAALLLLLDKYSLVQRQTLTTLAAYPRLFELLLALHVGGSGMSDLVSIFRPRAQSSLS